MEQTSLSANTGVGVSVNRLMLNSAIKINSNSLDNLVFIILLWCGYLAGVCISVANGVGYEGGDYFGESDNSKTDEGVSDGFFGFVEFACVARRGGVGDATVDNEYSGDYACYANEPLDGISHNFVCRRTSCVAGKITIECSACA